MRPQCYSAALYILAFCSSPVAQLSASGNYLVLGSFDVYIYAWVEAEGAYNSTHTIAGVNAKALALSTGSGVPDADLFVCIASLTVINIAVRLGDGCHRVAWQWVDCVACSPGVN